MRVDPSRKIVNTQAIELNVLEYGGADDVRAILKAHDPSKVADGGGNALADADFNTPIEHNAHNSVLEESYAVEQAADNDGVVTTSTGNTYSDNPGGYQVGYGSRLSSGQGNSTFKTTGGVKRKRALYGGDFGVLWVLADNPSVDLNIDVLTEQDF